MVPHWSGAVRDAKRDVLLNAARDEFVDEGLEGATMRSIALRAGCTTGAIYPLFESKEAIYAALLEQSLSRLDAHVAAAVSVVREPRGQVDAACRAFLDYYLSHRFEVNLGLYAFRGIKRQGVGESADRRLNQALWKVLERIADPLATARGVSVADVQPIVILLFSQMIGALVLQIAGRLDQLQIDPISLLRMLLGQLWALPLAFVEDSYRGVNRSEAKHAHPKSKTEIGRKRNGAR
jgi:TetR/AcrR family transcriptional regulator